MAFHYFASVFVFALVAQCALGAVPATPTVPLTPIAPVAAPTNTSTVWFRMIFLGQTNPPTTAFVTTAQSSIAASAQVQTSAVVFGNAQTVTVAGKKFNVQADALQMDVFINTASAADAQAVVSRITADVADGMIGAGASAISVTGFVNNTPGTPVVTPPAVPVVPVPPQTRVFVRFSVIITGIDLGTFSGNTAQFRQAVADILGVSLGFVTIIDTDLITFANKFAAQDVGLRIIFEASMPDQASANNAQTTLQNSINANGGRIGAYNVRNLTPTNSNGDNAALRVNSPVLLLGLVLAFVALLL